MGEIDKKEELKWSIKKRRGERAIRSVLRKRERLEDKVELVRYLEGGSANRSE